jgi:glycerophosphoryl diester phosphodiesterase
MSRKVLLAGAAVALMATGIWLNNTSLFDPPPSDARSRVLAHRGVYQTFPTDELDNETCTATLIASPQHPFLENTIVSMRAAFDSGAEVVELDVHLTPDGRFAAFHDWTLDCRTDGSGITELTSFDHLKTLDIGHGYRADGGRAFRFVDVAKF